MSVFASIASNVSLLTQFLFLLLGSTNVNLEAILEKEVVWFGVVEKKEVPFGMENNNGRGQYVIHTEY